MSESKLSVIRGLKVADAILTEADAGISFENGISLAIYNRYNLGGFVLSDAQRLIGSTVAYVDEGVDAITIGFENNWVLRIDMQDAAYTGPEAMQLRVPGEPIVIWS